MSRRHTLAAAAFAFVVIIVASCSERSLPLSPTSASAPANHESHALAGNDDKGYIDGWIGGETVHLYYTKSYFCQEPPSSEASSNCELGAPAEVAPRPGLIPTIYAIAAVGFTPDPSTVACLAGTPCLNHPAMIDASRVGGPAMAKPPSHSHVFNQRGGGWYNTVNIRVFTLAAWNEIAAAKTLEKVRELQGGNPAVGVPGVISADTPTNIYFFIAGER